MGRDKTALKVDDQPLVHRQLELLRRSGASDLWVSVAFGAEGLEGYLSLGARPVRDRFEKSGPLAGVHVVLESCECDLVLIVAVDMPRLTPDVLAQLVQKARPGCGVVPKSTSGYEPLAAVYPRNVAAEAKSRLERRSLSLQHFVGACVESGQLTVWDVSNSDRAFFENWNSPSDLPPGLLT
jgi:molybdopterin-guanine dinucleotide biosynthesis protein A